jgi:antitoxin YefM
MNTITYSAARAGLAKTMKKVCKDHEPVIITRQKEESVVMLSLEDYSSLEETAYLFGARMGGLPLLAKDRQNNAQTHQWSHSRDNARSLYGKRKA